MSDMAKKGFDIFINQCGYKPDSSKIAVMPFECSEFSVVNLNGDKVYSGKVSLYGYDKNSGDTVYKADFSDFAESGKYRITAGEKQSAAFEIGENVYDDLLTDILRAFYFLRCGDGLSEKHAGVYKHGECHKKIACEWDNPQVKKDVSGGWHDAGDYGRYVTAGACALAHLLMAYETFPQLEEMQMNIPESGSGVPDIISECRVELEWILKMQREDGGVYHKATTAKHAPFVMPEEDTADMHLFAVSSMATADTAAICAMASRIYSAYDKEFSERLYAAALRSYSWLENNPDFLPFNNPEGNNTGGYGEWEDRSNRYWAAAEMYVLTGKEKYHDDLKNLFKSNFWLAGLGYGDVGGFGSVTYFRYCKNPDEKIINRIKGDFDYRAGELKALADKNGYGVAMDEEQYHWGSNMEAMKQAMTFIIADIMCGEKRYDCYIQRLADYLLGYNALGISYVTGTGEYRANYPHLRPAHADGIEECIPGMVCGGPNRMLNDPDAIRLIPQGTPPMKCFVDNSACYSLNEVTIYWNSPAVFVFAYLL